MKIAVCQTSPEIGNLSKNFATIRKLYTDAQKAAADICVFPELCTSGYLAEDLFLNQVFIEEIHQKLEKLIQETGNTCLILGTPILKDGILYNAAIAAQNGKIIGQTYKQKLPNYGIFDEERYFTSGEPAVISINGFKVGIPICADIWSPSVCAKLKQQGAKLLITINGSPFEKGKVSKRITQVEHRFIENILPMIYCNQVIAQDGIIFDGRSFCFDGTVTFIGKAFEVDSQIIELRDNMFYPRRIYNNNLNQQEEIYQAMVLGVRHYVRDNGFSQVVLGLSGGIDSAMVAAIAVDALGANNVSALMLPSKFTSKESLEDARSVADCLNIKLSSIAINEILDSFIKTFAELLPINETSIAHQNLQSRIRGTILMAKANESNALLLTTGNKSEYATGYATIYGDMNGAFNPIKDIYKTELYSIAKYKNIFHSNILTKAPTAELAANQKDTDSLPEYIILDKILEAYLEEGQSKSALSKQFDPELVEKTIQLIHNSEFKRRQSAIGVKLSAKNFEKDRRFPITNHYRHQ